MMAQVLKQVNGGKSYFYPRNATAAGFCKLLGQKTLTTQNLKDLANVGVLIEILGGDIDTNIK